MAKLIQCAECNHNVSEDAPRCPQCKTRQFKPQPCIICHQKSKVSAMTDLSDRDLIGRSERYINLVSKLPINRRLEPITTGFAHRDCLNRVAPIRRSQAAMTRVTRKCPTCKNKLSKSLLSLTEKGDYQEPIACSECGEESYITLSNGSHRPCYYCGLLLDTNHPKTISLSNHINPNHADDFSHLYCYLATIDKRRNPTWPILLLMGLAAFAVVIWLGS